VSLRKSCLTRLTSLRYTRSVPVMEEITMKRLPVLALNLTLIFILLLSLGMTGVVAQAQPGEALHSAPQIPVVSTDAKLAYAPGRVVVAFQPGTNPPVGLLSRSAVEATTLGRSLSAQGVARVERLFAEASAPLESTLSQIYMLGLDPGADVLQAVKALSADPAIAWAEPDYLAYPAATTTDDPFFPDQWGLDQIDAPEAWDTTTGSGTVSIAIIDSGIDTTHPDLSGRLWVNPGEIAGNSLDDDNNGQVDDVNGWDFANSDNDPSDDNGHGTQVAGIVGAATDNGAGIAGVCWNCKLMNVKVMQAGGVANYSDIGAGVLYAAQKGARVINISLGGYSNSSALQTAIQSAVNTYGAVVVAGAGNDNLETPFYPAAYDEVLAVVGTDSIDAKVGLSNFGTWVDIAAPSEAISTTFQGGDYGSVDGTSYAAPFVAGVAGLLRSQHSDWSADTVRAHLIQTADDIEAQNPGFEGKLGSGRVNADTAVNTAAQPLLDYESHTVDDIVDGRPEPGTMVDLVVTLTNDWADTNNVQATLTSSDPHVTIDSSSAAFGDIPTYGQRCTLQPRHGFHPERNRRWGLFSKRRFDRHNRICDCLCGRDPDDPNLD
jgi:subtilisin family serine protease